ncbi:hydrogenase maturation protease [Geomonas sp. RF6]|uniref:hydrogenase maturation protease n=1 Tax=Geomonas sp. RF6 TaxID=2897342 RepID=UPI001E3611C2|nr:hydrogenase maturation protease [Geomonas sp. RF6]UFS71884.1 hydrogenase maturation protease [Geomonas sp. RF6]
MKTVVLGIGNLLLADEGVGVHAARALAQEELRGETEILDVGCAFLDALPALEDADRIIIVDAMEAGEAPGTVYRIPFAECRSRQMGGSLHNFDLARALFLCGRTSVPEVVVYGVEPAAIEWGLDLSPQVQETFGPLLEAIRSEIAGEAVQGFA